MLEEYYSLGIPKTIDSPEHINIIVKKLNGILKTNAEQLPRYNSTKSNTLFEYLTSYDSISKITKSLNDYQLQQEFLSNYAFSGNSLAGIYTLASVKKHYYENEAIICSSAKLHANLLFLELFEKQAEKKLSVTKENRIAFSKVVGRAYWGISQQVQSDGIDKYVKTKINNNLIELKTRINKLKVLDKTIVFDVDKCWP